MFFMLFGVNCLLSWVLFMIVIVFLSFQIWLLWKYGVVRVMLCRGVVWNMYLLFWVLVMVKWFLLLLGSMLVLGFFIRLNGKQVWLFRLMLLWQVLQLLFMNVLRFFFCCVLRVLLLFLRYRLKGEFGVIRVVLQVSMVSVMLLKLIGLLVLGKVLWKVFMYFGMLFRVCLINCGVLCILMLFWIGFLVCFFRFLVWLFQNCVVLNMVLKIVGELCGFFCQL